MLGFLLECRRIDVAARPGELKPKAMQCTLAPPAIRTVYKEQVEKGETVKSYRRPQKAQPGNLHDEYCNVLKRVGGLLCN